VNQLVESLSRKCEFKPKYCHKNGRKEGRKQGTEGGKEGKEERKKRERERKKRKKEKGVGLEKNIEKYYFLVLNFVAYFGWCSILLEPLESLSVKKQNPEKVSSFWSTFNNLP
jgi:hypothetical protein